MECICLVSITASHYRFRVYNEMQKQLGCSFIFGMDDTTVKRMDTSKLKNVLNVPNKHIGKTLVYYQPKVLKEVQNFKIIINDLGLFCITSWLLLLQAKLRGQKVYNWDHGWYGRESVIKKIIKRLYFGLADGSFIYGDYAVGLMKENGFNAKKLYTIHNSLDYEKQIELRNDIKSTLIYNNHFGNDYPVLIMIGRLNFRKNLHLLLEAIAILSVQKKFYNVVFVGDGEDKLGLENLVENLNIAQQVWFYGACYDEKKNAELIYNADMCVVPGDIGLTAIHAMTFGVPVISHDYYPNQGPEFEVIKYGLTGAFFKHDDVYSLVDAIDNWFITHQNERDLIRHIVADTKISRFVFV